LDGCRLRRLADAMAEEAGSNEAWPWPWPSRKRRQQGRGAQTGHTDAACVRREGTSGLSQTPWHQPTTQLGGGRDAASVVGTTAAARAAGWAGGGPRRGRGGRAGATGLGGAVRGGSHLQGAWSGCARAGWQAVGNVLFFWEGVTTFPFGTTDAATWGVPNFATVSE